MGNTSMISRLRLSSEFRYWHTNSLAGLSYNITAVCTFHRLITRPYGYGLKWLVLHHRLWNFYQLIILYISRLRRRVADLCLRGSLVIGFLFSCSVCWISHEVHSTYSAALFIASRALDFPHRLSNRPPPEFTGISQYESTLTPNWCACNLGMHRSVIPR